jgi:hypothetical protein
MGALATILVPLLTEIARLMVELFFPIKKETTNETTSDIPDDQYADLDRLRESLCGKASGVGKDGINSTDSGRSEDKSDDQRFDRIMDHG